MEADLVAHCGDNVAGRFVHSLVLTDIASGWTECVPLAAREGSTYGRWFTERGQEKKEHRWLKGHAICGVRTHVVPTLVVTNGNVNDSPCLPAPRAAHEGDRIHH